MKTILTPNQLIAYRVPEDSKDFKLVDMFGLPSVYYEDAMGFGNTFSIGFDNPDIILGTVNKGVIGFDVINIEYPFNSKGRFEVLLTNNSLSLDKKYLIIKPKN